MKKIVFVTEQLHRGGAERVTAALMNELCGEAEIHLVSTYHHDQQDEYPTDARIIPHIIDKPCRVWAGLILQRIAFLRKTITEIAPDCVVSLATTNTNILLTVALAGRKIPIVLSERNDPKRSPSLKPVRMLRPWIYQAAAGVVFQTNEAKDFFAPAIQQKSVVICNPLTGKLPPRYEQAREQRIINCCRLVPQKNLDLLIDAFSDIAPEFPQMVLDIFGEGTERERLEKKIADMGLQERIHLPGFSTNAHEEMRRSAMFVSSSDYEGISNSMLEAIALGVPTICTDCPAGGAREVIRHGENGLLVPVDDRSAMADAMRRVLREPELAEKMSKNGCMLRDELAADVIAKKWRDYMAQCVQTYKR
nr:glycosyltransferase family 4 protein [Clostridia bacterium]